MSSSATRRSVSSATHTEARLSSAAEAKRRAAQLDRRRVEDDRVAGADHAARLVAVAGADVDVEIAELELLLSRRAQAHHPASHAEAVKRRTRCTTATRGAQLAEPVDAEQPVVRDVADGHADLVDVRHERDERPVARRPRRVVEPSTSVVTSAPSRPPPRGRPPLRPPPSPRARARAAAGREARGSARRASLRCLCMATTATVNTDLLTPLGAYLRLREGGRASFLLESVERGRLGRNSWIGAGSRLVTFEEAERSSGRSSATSPTTTRRSSSRPSRCPPTGRPSRRAASSSRDTLVRFDHGAGTAEVLAGDPEEVASAPARRGRSRGAASGVGERRAAAPLPRPRALRGDGAHRQEHIVAGDAYQIVPSQRAERPTSATRARRSTARCAASTPRRTSSSSTSTTWR